jgi:SAM-dependent methyltransferase
VTLLDRIHARCVHPSRVRALSHVLARLMPPGASVLDVGTGDGRVGHLISQSRADVRLTGIDTTVRQGTPIPVREFDGRAIPFDANSWDVVLLVDVLHHTHEPAQLLEEAVRVCRKAIVIKDHLLHGAASRRILTLMDWVGNRQHGVELPYNYWRRERWLDEFARLDLEIAAWNTKLGLYPPPASWVFERGLHFVAQLVPRSSGSR